MFVAYQHSLNEYNFSFKRLSFHVSVGYILENVQVIPS